MLRICSGLIVIGVDELGEYGWCIDEDEWIHECQMMDGWMDGMSKLISNSLIIILCKGILTPLRLPCTTRLRGREPRMSRPKHLANSGTGSQGLLQVRVTG